MIVDDAAAIAAELRRLAPSAMLFRPAPRPAAPPPDRAAAWHPPAPASGPAKCQRCESDWWVRSGCVRCRTCSGEQGRREGS
jgi:hypothetical protein